MNMIELQTQMASLCKSVRGGGELYLVAPDTAITGVRIALVSEIGKGDAVCGESFRFGKGVVMLTRYKDAPPSGTFYAKMLLPHLRSKEEEKAAQAWKAAA